MLRRIHDPDRGATLIEHAAVILLVAAIAASVLSAGLPQRVADLYTNALNGITTDQEPPTPTANGPNNHPEQDGGQPNQDTNDQGQDNDQPGQGGQGGETSPVANPSQDGGDQDQGPPSLGLNSLMPGLSPPSTDQVTDTAGDLLDASIDIQQRIQNRAAERAKEGLDSTIDLFTTNPITTAQETASGVYNHLHDQAMDSYQRWIPEYQKGNRFTAIGGMVWDTARNTFPHSATLDNLQEGRERMADGQTVEVLVDEVINTGMVLIPGPKLKLPTAKPDTPNGREPDPEAQHLADGETNGRGGNRDEDNDRDGAACPANNSFTPGTPVLLADGTSVPIEDIAVGDEVLAFDPLTGEEGPREVTDTITGNGEKTLVDITTTGTNGETSTITATDEHPFWAPEPAEWVDAIDLTPGTWLRTASGTWTQVTAVEADTVDNQTVHNLTVDDLNTYYALSGETPTLVHNQSNSSCSYSGRLIQVNKPDLHADKLAQRIGGDSRVRFENDKSGREFDVVSNDYIGQAKGANEQVNKDFRKQAKATFEAASQTGRDVYYHFQGGAPDRDVRRKLEDYANRYGVNVIIDDNPISGLN